MRIYTTKQGHLYSSSRNSFSSLEDLLAMRKQQSFSNKKPHIDFQRVA